MSTASQPDLGPYQKPVAKWRPFWTEPANVNGGSRTYLAANLFDSKEEAEAFAEKWARPQRGYGATVSDEPAGYNRRFDVEDWKMKGMSKRDPQYVVPNKSDNNNLKAWRERNRTSAS